MSNTKTVYRFDSAGYYLGTSLAQFVGKSLLLPSDCTETQPKQKDGYWSKWSGSKWVNEKIPTSCAECIEKGLTCISNGQGQHNYEVKSLLESLVAADNEHYKIVVSSDFVEQIEEIPAKTLDEVKSDKLAELDSIASQFDSYKCDTMFITSSVGGYRFNADIRSQTNLQGLISVLDDSQTTLYKDYDNEFRTLNKEQMQTIFNECILNGQNLYATKWKYQAQIGACTTIEEVQSIDIKFEMMDFSENS